MTNRYGLFLCVVFAFAGCDGSGGGIGGSGVVPPIESNGATLGAISGFGSIVVNGERYDTDSAEFFVNERPIAQSDLRIGMNVLAAVNFSSRVATQVEYVPSLIGLVESVNLTEKSLQSLGQTIQLGGGTSFENLSLAEIAPGMVVEVSGLRDARGVIFATFIRPAQDATRIQLVGTILSELGEDQVFSLSGLTVNIAQADLSQVSPDELEFGDKVYVTADSVNFDPAQGLLSVNSVRVALEPMVSVGDRVEVEGIVSTFTSAFEFDVYWQPVVATDQTVVEYQDGTLADLSLIRVNTRLEIEGVVQDNGAYKASRIILIARENTKITSSISSMDSANKTFTVLGLDVEVTSDTDFDGSADDDDNQGGNDDISSFEDLRVGDYVEVEAAYVGNRLLATSVEVDDQDARAILEGPVTALAMTPERISVVNQAIVLGTETSYENRDDIEISRDAFIQQLQVGIAVKARWDEFQSLTLPPDSIELE